VAPALPPRPAPGPPPARALSIVHIAAELAPHAKVGGLGDVVAGLARACVSRGHDALVCLPFYECLPEGAVNGLAAVDAFDVLRGGGRPPLGVTVHTGTLDGVPVALFRPDWGASPLFRGARIYGGNHSEVDAYLFLCRAVLDWLSRAVASGDRPRPDSLHQHDWQCAPAAMLFWHAYARALNPGAAVVLTIHNFDSAGECRTDEWKAGTGYPATPFATVDRALDERTIGHNPERLCLLKGGIVYANGGVVTVSPTYAREAAEGGAAGWLRSTLLRPDVRRRFLGVLNGIDVDAWNPGTDAWLPLPYTASTAAAGKSASKKFVQLGLGLALDPAAPLAVCISRLVPQKGVHLIRHAAIHVAGTGGQFVLLGTGHADGEFRALADGQFRDSPSAKMCLFYSEALAHLLYAAADFVVVPSMFEPCGLTQLIALRYGAVPVVRSTGGLADTVTDVDADPAHGNGFAFTGADEASLDGALGRALAMHRDRPGDWAGLVSRNMAEDVGWAAAAGEYVRLYEGDLVVK
jgi:starch synthase